jgi:hypothetical protein
MYCDKTTIARSVRRALFMLACVATTPALAQAEEDKSAIATPPIAWGTSHAPNAAEIQTDVALGTLASSAVFTKAGYGTGGVALRNRGGGNISVSGVSTPTRAAYLYWAVITEGAAPKAAESVKIQRVSPTIDTTVATVNGTVLGTAASPCWSGNTITVFKGNVPLSIANGNGSYQISLLPGASGSTAGGDPWLTTPVLPLFEGASLALVGKGSGTVAIYDEKFGGHTFASNPGLTYTLKLPEAAPGKMALFDNIGADGQHGSSRTAVQSVSEKYTTINSVSIAGPGSQYNDGDWNGSSGLPLPELWDDTSHDITSAVAKGTKTLDVSFATTGSQYDCLTTVANLVLIE